MGVYTNPVGNALNTPSVTQDLIANRPPFGIYGRWFHGTDDNILYWDNGTAWVAMTSGGGGGNVTTAGGTPPFLPKWDTATDLNDSRLYQQVFAAPFDAIWNDYPFVANDVRSFFVKLLAPSVPSSETCATIRDSAHAANIMEVAALAAAGLYTQLVHAYIIPDVLFWQQTAGGTLTLQANNGSSAHVAIKDELQTVGDILGGADVSATNDILAGNDVLATQDVSAANDLLANGNVAVGGTVSTGDPGGGAGAWKLGAAQAGVLVSANFLTVEVNGVQYKILCQ